MNFLLGCFGWTPAEMPRTDDKTTRFWLWVFKIPLIILVGVAGFYAKGDYDFLTAKGNERLLMSPPYNPHIELAQHLTYVGLMTLFGWLFISSFLITYARSVWLFLFGLVDLALALTIAVGVGYQADYLPSSSNGCTVVKAVDWQVSGDTDSFFVVAQKLGNGKSPSDPCNRFVRDWQLAIGVLFIQMLITYIEIFFDTRPRSVLHPCRPLYLFMMTLFLPATFIQYRVFPKIRFTYRYALNLTRRIRGMKPLDLPHTVTYTPRYDYIVWNPKLQDILNIEHILLDIVKYLHYEDIINLSLTSRAVREAVYPGGDLAFRVPKLNKHCCKEGARCLCLYCNKRICSECKDMHHWPGLPGRRHITCKPICVKCYYKKHCSKPRACVCHIKDTANEWQDMCRTCGKGEQELLQLARHKRYQQEARDIAFGLRSKGGWETRCWDCKSDMKSGIRFWLCGKCFSPCKDTIHPASVVLRQRDVEKAQGNEKEETIGGWKHIFLDKFKVQRKQAG